MAKRANLQNCNTDRTMRSDRLAGIVRFTVPKLAKRGDGKLETHWCGMKDNPNEKYQLVYTQAIQHMAASKGRLLYLYKRLMCVLLFDMYITMNAGVMRKYGCASSKCLLAGERSLLPYHLARSNNSCPQASARG